MWQKMGLIYAPNRQYHWNQSHAQVPVVEMCDDYWRIYYSTRDINNHSRISYVDVEAGNPKNILFESNDYILDIGELGAFDDAGVMPTCIITRGGERYLYYIGWTIRQSVPYQNALGLAISKNGAPFQRVSKAPILGISYHDPFFVGTAFIFIEQGLWRMWYLSCVKWTLINDKLEPFYHIKYAESGDGIKWNSTGLVAIDFKDEHEAGIASATVLKTNNIYQMWYSYRGADNYRNSKKTGYQIGYAVSSDGLTWQRQDEKAGITRPESGWDSLMQAYPYVIQHNKKKYLFYNGNQFGREGFGYAIWKND